MRVLHVIPSLKKGGAERLVLDICNELNSRKDFSVLLITFRPDNDYEFLTNNINWKTIPSEYIPSLTGGSKVNISQLQLEINNFEPDVIHSHLFESEIVLSKIRLTQVKRVIHFHDNMIQYKKVNLKTIFSKKHITANFEKREVLKSYKKSSTTFIAISKNTEKYFKTNLPSGYDVKFLPNAINLDRFKDNNQNKFESKVITMIGSFVKKKNQLLAISVIKELKKKGYNFDLFLLGDGELKEELDTKSKEFGLKNNVYFEGNVDHPEKYLNNSFCYLHTATYEPFGLVIIEAMATGLPVVCVNGGGNTDIVKHNLNGYIFDDLNPKSLANAIIELKTNDTLFNQMSYEAYKTSRQYDIIRYCDELQKLYTSSLI